MSLAYRVTFPPGAPGASTPNIILCVFLGSTFAPQPGGSYYSQEGHFRVLPSFTQERSPTKKIPLLYFEDLCKTSAQSPFRAISLKIRGVAPFVTQIWLPSMHDENPLDSWVLANQRANFNFLFGWNPLDSWDRIPWILIWRSCRMVWKFICQQLFQRRFNHEGMELHGRWFFLW
jgi:hypothetical protein